MSRLRFDQHAVALALGASLPALAAALVLLWTGGYSAKVQWTVTTVLGAVAAASLVSLRVHVDRDRARAVFDGLRRRGIVPDWREPDVIRAAPVPFYNSFDDAWRFADALGAELAA